MYDSRIGRRWNTDPIFKEYESPYCVFGNNPIWLIDPNGADTSKHLSDARLVDAIKISYNNLKSHIDNRTFSLVKVKDYSVELDAATRAYWEKNQSSMGFAEYNEFQQQVSEYHKGLIEVAAAVNGAKLFNDFGSNILYNKKVSNYSTVTLTRKLINEKNGEFGHVAAGGVQALGVAIGSAWGIQAGPGPRAPFKSNISAPLNSAPQVSFGGNKVSVYRGANGDNPLFQLKGGEYKYTEQTVRGLSIHVDAPKLTNARGASYKIIQMPKGLKIVQQGKDPGHFEIVPTSKLNQQDFQKLLNQIKVE